MAEKELVDWITAFEEAVSVIMSAAENISSIQPNTTVEDDFDTESNIEDERISFKKGHKIRERYKIFFSKTDLYF